jgi:hypothetical protein
MVKFLDSQQFFFTVDYVKRTGLNQIIFFSLMNGFPGTLAIYYCRDRDAKHSPIIIIIYVTVALINSHIFYLYYNFFLIQQKNIVHYHML